jgi:hypothetical protein
MPYKLQKAPGKDLYYVVTIDTGKKHSNEPISKEKAEAQMRLLDSLYVKEMADKHEKYTDFDHLKSMVIGVKCRKIDMAVVEKMTNKTELIKYLREHECPVLRRAEALMEEKMANQ